jgi:hypothetical protein
VIPILLRYWPVAVLLVGVVAAIWLIVRRHRRPRVAPPVPAPTPPVPTLEEVAANVPPVPAGGKTDAFKTQFLDELHKVLAGQRHGVELSTRGELLFWVTKVGDVYVVIRDHKNTPPQHTPPKVRRYVCAKGQLPWLKEEPRDSSQHDNTDTKDMVQGSVADVRGLIIEIKGAYARHP